MKYSLNIKTSCFDFKIGMIKREKRIIRKNLKSNKLYFQ